MFELNEVYSAAQVVERLQQYGVTEDVLFTKRKNAKLMVFHTDRQELVFRVLDGDRVQLVDKSALREAGRG